MKKTKLFALFVLCIFIFAGCNKSNATLSLGEIERNTLFITEDGNVQTAVVEDFDKDYYEEEALKEFIDTTVEEYNQSAGEDAIQINSVRIKDKIAGIVLTYKDVDTYALFNEVDAKFMTVEEAGKQGLLPEVFYNSKGSEKISSSEVMENGNYKVIILNEKYDVAVNGKIKYYSGALPLNSKTVQTTGEDVSVIVFKP